MRKTKHTLTAIGIVLAIVLVGTWAFAGPWGMAPWMTSWGFGMGWFGIILRAAFWIGAIVAIVFLIRWLIVSPSPRGGRASSEDSALVILKRRYAGGEINKEEFRGKMKDLGY